METDTSFLSFAADILWDRTGHASESFFICYFDLQPLSCSLIVPFPRLASCSVHSQVRLVSRSSFSLSPFRPFSSSWLIIFLISTAFISNQHPQRFNDLIERVWKEGRGSLLVFASPSPLHLSSS